MPVSDVFPNPDAPMRDVEGKVAFITGGDSGIGLGIARACAAAGMKVVITYRSSSHREQATATLLGSGADFHAINVDVTDRKGMASAAAETVRHFGKVHVLINNAGVVSMLPLGSTTYDDWDWCMNVNLNGVFNGIQTFLPYIKAHGEGGQIVTTSSMLGGMLAGPLWGAYSAAKFAVVGMMEALRAELAELHIGVSVFCPAGVSSDLDHSDRNRPPELAENGVPDLETQIRIRNLDSAVERTISEHNDPQALMDPLEAGEHVLHGIRSNALYIFSHPEYEQLLRERTAALLASITRPDQPVPLVRKAMTRIFHNPIYANELKRLLQP
jgi:NAD(P)-dependent dehydrogenase (short-subunit alcohol dehydrogenase family)